MKQRLSLAPKELLKRKREIGAITGLGVLFTVLTFAELRLVRVSQTLPFVHSIFFFGLVNFNIILLLLLFFLVFRNIVKVFVESEGKIIGSSLKSKLIAAFVAFASVPTALMFLVSVFYINSSFDKWFSVRMASVLKNSLEVNQESIFSAKKRNYHFAHLVADEIRVRSKAEVASVIERAQKRYDLDAIEYYPGLFSARIVSLAGLDGLPKLPPVSLEFLKKGLQKKAEASMIQHFGEGNLIRVIVPVERGVETGALVLSTFMPISLISKIDDISAAHEEFRNVNPLEYPIKSIYLAILSLMTLVILLCATWFGFYLARELAVPLDLLGNATKRISAGDYEPVAIRSGSKEINQLVGSFNQMIQYLERSKREVLQANKNLTETLEQLDEHSRYIQVVLSNVTTGVVSLSREDVVSTLNRHAEHLLNVSADSICGRRIKEILPEKDYQLYLDVIENMRVSQLPTFHKEMRISINGQEIPMQVHVSLLHDDRGQEIGKVLVFDDLSVVLNAQRAAAWTEVARRIAHEIKNPLTPIKLSAQRLERKFGGQIQDPTFKSSVAMIVRQTDDLKRLVNEFSNFARLPQTKPIKASLSQVVEEAVDIYIEAHREIQFSVDLDALLPDFLFDPDQIRRVLINVLDNAVAAVEEIKDSRISLRTQYESSLKMVRISVIDNGKGIPDDDRDRVFEPYFSTKESGTGLGLAIVRRIVEDHNGFIRALPIEPNGTKILIELPVNEADLQLAQDSTNNPELPAAVKDRDAGPKGT